MTEAPPAELPKYKCHKIVEAVKITAIAHSSDQDCDLFFDRDGGGDGIVKCQNGYLEKHDPHVGGYYVRDDCDYESYSPVKAFERGYTRI